MDTLEVKITTGNDAMQTDDEIAQALMRVAHRVRDGSIAGKVADINGNTVGSYEFRAERLSG